MVKFEGVKMKKKSLIAPVYLILLFVFIFLTSCTNNSGLSQTNSSPTSENPSSQTSSNPIVEETFLITFDANGGEFEDGSAKKVVEIDSGQLLTLPTTALEHRSFYTFVGWSYLSDPNELWDFSNDVVQREMTLYAMWQSQWFDYEIIDSEATIIDSNLDASTTTIEIPSAIRDVDGKDYSVTTIGDNAFFECTSLTSVVIPSSVTTIEDSAFFGCINLTSVVIPNSVTTIGDTAFWNCRNLINIVIPNSVTTIGNSAFSFCTSLTSVVIPNSVTTIGDRAFSGCSNLTIYCEATSQPSGWDYDWNDSNRPVVWGYNSEN